MPVRVEEPKDPLVEPGEIEQPGPPSYTAPMDAAGDGAVRFVVSPAGHLGPFRAAVSERTGGVSRYPYRSLNVGRSTDDDPECARENEQIVLRALGLADRVARLRLEHGARVLQPDGPGLHGPADALLSDDPGLVLWFTVADCIPVTIVASTWRVHGHCGWRGVVAGLVEAMAAALAKASTSSPGDLRAWIGAGIGPCCYQVGPEVAERVDPVALRSVPPAPGHPTPRTFLDLRREIALRLARLGVPAGGVAADPSCTSCEPARFFSHRRDGVPTGRLAALCFRDPTAAHAPGARFPTSSR
jgi:polyphenol oxidase